MAKKHHCRYCYGHGISKYWVDTGIADSRGVRHPVRFLFHQQQPIERVYACEKCGYPKDAKQPTVEIR